MKQIEIKSKKQYFYLLKFQYLGFRFHGWQKQTDNYRTVQGMLERTLNFIFEEKVNFKTMGASRTDSMVSANEAYCKITTHSEINIDFIFEELNKNLPADIHALELSKTTREFRIINDSKSKTYQYFFSNISKAHPFSAPFITNFHDKLDIELMKKAATLFEGEHNFSRYCYRPTPSKQYVRTLNSSKIIKNTEMTASFFPDETYIFEVQGAGFLRNQIRLMMGALIMVGSNQMSLEELEQSLIGQEFKLASFIAPASGLMLKELKLRA